MPNAPPPDWATIAHRYIETSDAIADICRDGGITEKDLHNARKRNGWKRQKPRAVIPPRRRNEAADPTTTKVLKKPSTAKRSRKLSKAATTPAATATSKRPPLKGSSSAARRKLLARLVAAISLKLEQLERRMHNDLDRAGDDQSATDHERETRAIGALIDNLDKLTEMQSGHGHKPGAAARSAPDLAGEADRYRRELAERLQRIVGAHTGKS